MFAKLPAPSETDVARLCASIARRVMRLLGEDEEAEPVVEQDDAAIATVQAEALHAPVRQRRFFGESPEPPPKRAPLSAVCAGFSLHAGLALAAEDRRTLCRLLQYGSRPPFAQKRLSLRAEGTVRLKLRKPTPSGQTEIRLSPEAFLKRLLAILPPPRWHLTRYHGGSVRTQSCGPNLRRFYRRRPRSRLPIAWTPMPMPCPTRRRGPSRCARRPRCCFPRTFPGDLGACEQCGGKMRLISCIDTPEAITKILSHLGLPTDLPRPAPSRDPPQLLLLDEIDSDVTD